MPGRRKRRRRSAEARRATGPRPHALRCEYSYRFNFQTAKQGLQIVIALGTASRLDAASRSCDATCARGNAGCSVHPQPRVRIGSSECTRVFTAVAPEITRHPRARMVLTAYVALFPAIRLSCHRRPWSLLRELDVPGERLPPRHRRGPNDLLRGGGRLCSLVLIGRHPRIPYDFRSDLACHAWPRTSRKPSSSSDPGSAF